MAKYHFIEDYEKLVADLVSSYPLDEAMERAVGGKYDLLGGIECDILRYVGLRDGMSVLDLGCGSGRLAHALGKAMKIDYCGIDIIEDLLAYARTKAPESYRFILHRALSLPVPDKSVDVACAFSVFTHLLPAEIYLYLEHMRRVLKDEGRVVFSFFEFTEPNHWPAFETAIATQRDGAGPHLNAFIERAVIDIWCGKLGFERVEFIDSTAAPQGGPALGQSLAILRPV